MKTFNRWFASSLSFPYLTLQRRLRKEWLSRSGASPSRQHGVGVSHWKPRAWQRSRIQECLSTRTAGPGHSAHAGSLAPPELEKLSGGFHSGWRLMPSIILQPPLNTCPSALLRPWRIASWALQLLLKLWEFGYFLEIAGSAIVKSPF